MKFLSYDQFFLLEKFMLGKGGSKETFQSTENPDHVVKNFTAKVNQKNLEKEKALSEKYPEFIAQIYNLDFKKGTLTQEKVDPKKFKKDILVEFSKLPPEVQDEYDESGLDDEYEFFVNNMSYIKTPELKKQVEKLQNFVAKKLAPITGSNIDYPNINNVGYDKDGNLKMIEIFY